LRKNLLFCQLQKQPGNSRWTNATQTNDVIRFVPDQTAQRSLMKFLQKNITLVLTQ